MGPGPFSSVNQRMSRRRLPYYDYDSAAVQNFRDQLVVAAL